MSLSRLGAFPLQPPQFPPYRLSTGFPAWGDPAVA